MGSNASQVLELVVVGKDKGGSKVVSDLGTAAEKSEKQTNNLGKTATNTMVGIGVAATALALKAAGTFENVGGEVMKLQRYTGGTAEDMSKLRFAAQQTGTDVDTLAKSMGLASKNLAASKDPMKDFGIAAKDAEGHVKPMDQVLLLVAEKFKGMPNGAEKTAAAMKLFGRSGAEMIPFLNRGAEGLQQLMEKAQAAGLVLSGDDLKAVKESKQAHRDLDAAMEGLGITVGRNVIPLLTSLTSAAAKIPGPLVEMIAPLALVGGGLLGIVAAGSKVVGVVSPIVTKVREMDAATTAAGGSVGSLGSKIGVAAVAVGGAVAAYEIWNARMKEASKNADSLAAIYDKKLTTSTTFDQLGDRLKTTRDQVQSLGDTAKSMKAPWDQDDAWEMVEYQKRLASSADAAARLQNEIKLYANEHRVSLDVATNAVEKQHAEADAQKALKDATEGTTMAIDDQINTLRAAVEPLFAAENATRKNQDAQKAAREATWAVAAAQKEYNQQSAIWGTNSNQAKAAWDKLTEAQQKKSDADVSTARSALDLEMAQRKLSDGITAGTVPLDQARDMLDRWVASGLMTRSQADIVAQKFLDVAVKAGQIPKDVNTNVTADTTRAEERLNALLWRYKNGGLTIGSVIQAVPQHAKGAFYPARVGGASMAIGAEAGQGEFVLPEDKLNAALRAAVASGGGRGGGGGLNLNVNVAGSMLGRDVGAVVVDALLQFKRTNPAIWAALVAA